MSLIRGPLSESLDPSRFHNLDGGCSTSTSIIGAPLKVSLIVSRERKMRSSSDDGNGLFVGGPWDDPPRPQFPHVFTILKCSIICSKRDLLMLLRTFNSYSAHTCFAK